MADRQHSRFSTLNVFAKMGGARPPRPPPKDQFYIQSSASAVSLAPSHTQSLARFATNYASSSNDKLNVPPQTSVSSPPTQFQHGSIGRSRSPSQSSYYTTQTFASPPTSAGSFLSPETGGNAFKKGFSKLSSLSKRALKPQSSKTFPPLRFTASQVDLGSVPPEHADDGTISFPFDLQHDLHVDEGLSNLPTTWLESLRSAGLKDDEITSIHMRRQQTGRPHYLQDHPDVVLSSSPSPPPSAIVSAPIPGNMPVGYASSLRSQNSRSPPATYLSPAGLAPRGTTPVNVPKYQQTYPQPGQRVGDNASIYSALSQNSSRPDVSLYGGYSGRSVSSRDGGRNSPAPSQTSFVTVTDSRSEASHSSGRSLPRSARGYQPDANMPSVPSTPPTRTTAFRVMNDSPTPDETMSPPPAYGTGDYSHRRSPSMSSTYGGPPLGDTKGRQESHRREESMTRTAREREMAAPGSLQRLPPRSDSLHRTRSRSHSRTQSRAQSPPQLPTQPPRTPPPARARTAPPAHAPPPPPFEATARTPPPSIPSRKQGTPSSRESDDAFPSASLSPPQISINIPRSSPRPPRLSLHQDNEDDDLSSWSAALLSAVSSSPDVEPSAKPASNAPSGSSNNLGSAMKSRARITPSSSNTLSVDQAGSTQTAYYSGVPSLGPSTPLFEEVMGLVRGGSSKFDTGLSPDSRGSAIYQPSGSSVASDRDSQLTVIAPYGVSASRLSAGSANSAGSRFSGESVLSGESHILSKATIVRAASVLIAKPATYNMVPTPRKTGANSLSPTDAISETEATEDASQDVETKEEDTVRYPDIYSPAKESFGRLSPPTARSTSPYNSPSVRSSSSDSSSAVLPQSVKSVSANSSFENGTTVKYDGFSCDAQNGFASSMLIKSIDITDGSRIKGSPTDSEFSTASGPTGISVSSQNTMANGSFNGSSRPVPVSDRMTESVPPEYPGMKETSLNGDLPDIYDQMANDMPQQQQQPVIQRLEASPRSPQRPQITVNGACLDVSMADTSVLPSPASSTPGTPAARYRGWVNEVVAPLSEFLDDVYDPRELFGDLVEIAEGESGSVYAARLLLHQPKSRPKSKSNKSQRHICDQLPVGSMLAIKNVPISPSGSPKLNDLRRELGIMSNVRHKNILSMDGLYVDFVEDALWIQMELMERSLADVLALADEGLVMQETAIARFSSDLLQALVHLELLGIAHRDVRSDNLLINHEGVLKLADFSNAVQVHARAPMLSEPAGVIYWQAPEIRSASYDARKVDVWSLGATTWEMAESEPPFSECDDPQQLSDKWPPLAQPDRFSQAFHDFLALCSRPAASRPMAKALLTTPFINSASPRVDIMQLLSLCKEMEERLLRRQSNDSQGTILL